MALRVGFTKKAEKELLRAPLEIQERISTWIKSLQLIGLEATRVQGGNGLHDEALSGKRHGQRSIRLNRSWRLIYSIDSGELKILLVLKITKHDYS